MTPLTPAMDIFRDALAAHEAGRLAEAERLYRDLLQTNPRHADALHLLGVVAHQHGRHEQAVDLIRKAIEISPQQARYYNNLGEAYRSLCWFEQAKNSYEQAIRLEPDLAEPHENLGILLMTQGEKEPAIDSFLEVIARRPDCLKTHFRLGTLKYENRDLAGAIYHLGEAVRRKPDWSEAQALLGLALREQGRLQQAIFHLKQALRIEPGLAPTANALGNIYLSLNHSAEALAAFEQSLQYAPASAETHANRGIALKNLGRIDESVAACRRAVQLRPDFADGHNNLGTSLRLQGSLEDSEVELREAIRLRPDFAFAHNNLGNTLLKQGKIGEAVACYDDALRFTPNYAMAKFNRAVALLLSGDWAQGLFEYEWRWKRPDAESHYFPPLSWEGGALEGRRIMLYAEQGLGDTLQFIRYAPLVQASGGQVTVVSQEPLVPILSRCSGIDLLLARGESLPSFDVYAPLMSLPLLFRNQPTNVPANTPYLFADPDLIASWKERLGTSSRFRIGICWHGDPKSEARNRPIPPAAFARLAQISGVELVCLQKGPGIEMLDDLPESFPITRVADLDEEHGAFMDSAAIIMNLDLVISCDTAMAHLAGGLGRPVWVALPTIPDWRWVLGRDDSPWYPSMRLFRQTKRADWASVFERMAVEIERRR